MMQMVVRACVLGLMAQGAAAQDYPAFHAVVGVALDDVLNIRAQPDANAPIIGEIPPDAMGVEVVAVSDGWAVVNTPDVTGYVALRFLEREEGPPWNALELPLTCLGTEPFWSLALDPVAGTAKFSTPEDAEAHNLTLGQTWPGAPWAPSAAVSLPDGMAVFSPAECSDGMSERSYGIAADLFLTGPDRQRLSGCCLLDLP
jgi:uncharacterized membrane protein